MAKKTKKKAKKKARKYFYKEARVDIGGVVSTASWENLKPLFGTTVGVARNTTPKEYESILDELEKPLLGRIERMANRAKSDVIEKEYSYIQFRTYRQIKYPRVTSILFWHKNRDKPYQINMDHLNQYAARGTIVDKLIELYFENGRKWQDPLKIPELKEQVSLLVNGSLGLSWHDCSYKEFFKKYKNRIKHCELKVTVYNHEHLYSGEIDVVGDYEEKRSIIDVKTGTYDICQLAAYAACKRNIKQLVIFPVGPAGDVKCGYHRPVVEENIESKFKEFLRIRAAFRQRFGI